MLRRFEMTDATALWYTTFDEILHGARADEGILLHLDHSHFFYKFRKFVSAGGYPQLHRVRECVIGGAPVGLFARRGNPLLPRLSQLLSRASQA
ncbi:Protein of unknown function, partial [Gryllus bimaculatus]